MPKSTGGRKTKESRIVRAIFDSIKGALHKGETVEVLGIGRFRVVTKPARKRSNVIYYKARLTVMLPEYKYVRFDPSPSMLDELNKKEVRPNG